MKTRTADFVVIGAGVFGVWIAHFLRRRCHSVVLADAYGAGNNRSSSGDESRIIRMGYGPDTLYTRWASRSLHLWQELFAATGNALFINTGVLWLGSAADPYTRQMADALTAEGIRHEDLSAQQIAKRFPQISLEDVSYGVFEPGSGVLLARRSVQAVLDDAIRLGVQYVVEAIVPPVRGSAHLEFLHTRNGDKITAHTFIFACGAWLPSLFPEILGDRIFPTRQEVFFFGPPPGSIQYKSPAMPVWLHHDDQMYGLPDIENRGIKIACDKRGESVDPETNDRMVGNRSLQEMCTYVGRRLPQLQGSPPLETRVCQYENTSNGDFLIDRHPEIDNIWLVGGGSGHGFKHGPAVGNYVAERVLGAGDPEQRFSLERKFAVQQREVY